MGDAVAAAAAACATQIELRTLWIISFSNDLHALVVKKRVQDRGLFSKCNIIFIDELSRKSSGSKYNASHEGISFRIDGGKYSKIEEGDVVWSRRSNPLNFSHLFSEDHDHKEFIALALNDLIGLAYFSSPGAIWINDLHCARRAENKLIQLMQAKSVGLLTPDYISTNDDDKFNDDMVDRYVLKSIRSNPGFVFKTINVSRDLDKDSIFSKNLPILQLKLTGERNIRACVFGNRVVSAQYFSKMVDTRPDYNQKMTPCELPAPIEQKLHLFLRTSGLRMGIFDLREDENGNLFFLECNQQGQFIYLEPKLKINIVDIFCEYLASSS